MAVAALLAVDDVYAYPQWSARALVEAGRAFEQLKQNDQASAQYAVVVSKYKDTPEAGLAQERLKAIKNGRASAE
jgi:TolA-binding protein